MSAMWSTILRLISSGTRWSKQRLPASMWKTGILRRLAGNRRQAASWCRRGRGTRPACSARALRRSSAMILPDRLRRVSPGRSRKWSRLPEPEILEEDLVQLVVAVLAGVDEHVVEVAVERSDDPREPDDLRSRSDDGHHLHASSAVIAFAAECVGPRRVEDLARPEECHHLTRRRGSRWSGCSRAGCRRPRPRPLTRSSITSSPGCAGSRWRPSPCTTQNFSILVWW